MIARAAAAPESPLRLPAAARRPSATRSIGSGRPITPVLQTSTSTGSRPRAPAARAHIRSASRSPWAPVQALAFPEFSTTAWIAVPRRRVSWEMTTGAALTRFWVKTPAPAQGRSLITTAMSSRLGSPSRMPAPAVPARKPSGAQTPVPAAPPGAATGTPTDPVKAGSPGEAPISLEPASDAPISLEPASDAPISLEPASDASISAEPASVTATATPRGARRSPRTRSGGWRPGRPGPRRP